jgi:hypothetical protein
MLFSKSRHRTVQIAFCFILAMICIHFDRGPVHAASVANPVVIRYLNDAGFVSSFELSDALGYLKDKGSRLEPIGDSPHSIELGAAAFASLKNRRGSRNGLWRQLRA